MEISHEPYLRQILLCAPATIALPAGAAPPSRPARIQAPARRSPAALLLSDTATGDSALSARIILIGTASSSTHGIFPSVAQSGPVEAGNPVVQRLPRRCDNGWAVNTTELCRQKIYSAPSHPAPGKPPAGSEFRNRRDPAIVSKNTGRALLLAIACAGAQHARGQPVEAETEKASAALDLRYRYESVEQADFDNRARASLLRTRLILRSGEASGFSALLEIDNVSGIGGSNYNSTENGNTDYPTIADPEGTEINQAALTYSFAESGISLGRQRILLGDMRFIGRKPWRLNEQTYDGLRLQWRPDNRLNVDVSYVNQINRIFGPEDGSNPADWHGDNLFLRTEYSLDQRHKLIGFAHRVDVEAQAGFAPDKTVNNSSDTVGVEYRGSFAGAALRASLATQRDAASSELSYRAPYYVAEVHAPPWRGLKVKAAYEVLGADNGAGFSTPLANGHRYQGWADKFLATPFDGLEDAWLSVEGRLGPLALTARYHHFQAESSNTTFGEELDLQAQWPVSKRLTATLKTALFNSEAGDRYADTTKAWLMLQFRL
jgi:hypothetical protein